MSRGNLAKAITSETLREHVPGIAEYIEWKGRYLPHKDKYRGWDSGNFLIAVLGDIPREYRNKAPWHVKTPNLADVQAMLNEAIRALDEEFSDGELPPVEETLPPDIKHWRPLLNAVFITARLVAYGIVLIPSAIAASALCIACSSNYHSSLHRQLSHSVSDVH
ncbi:hypothetical protein J3R83DRAFT_12526 [Lanmaoa asiatica]|nr:hypothetical protein J3R83DRAFT_12526 [Lanmaoa asiatica]